MWDLGEYFYGVCVKGVWRDYWKLKGYVMLVLNLFEMWESVFGFDNYICDVEYYEEILVYKFKVCEKIYCRGIFR